MLNNVAKKKATYLKKKDEITTPTNVSNKIKPKRSSCNRIINWMFGSPS